MIEARVREALLRGEDPWPKTLGRDLTFHQLLKLVRKHPRFQNQSATDRRNHFERLTQFFGSRWGDRRVGAVTRADILAAYQDLKARGRSHCTIERYHWTLCLAWDLYLEWNPAAVHVPKLLGPIRRLYPKQPPTREIDFLTDEEVELLIAAAGKSQKPLLRPFVELVIYTGLRRHEALTLRFRDIDRTGGIISVRSGKGNKPRRIPLDPRLIPTLDALDHGQSLVIASRDGTQPHEDSFIQPLRVSARRAGIRKRVDIHTLRHSFGSNLVRGGLVIAQVSRLLGHSDIRLTAERYIHLLDGDLRVRNEFRKPLPTPQHPAAGGAEGNPVPEIQDAVLALLVRLEREIKEGRSVHEIARAIADALP